MTGIPKGRRPRIETGADGRRSVVVTIAPTHAATAQARSRVEASACSKVHWWLGVEAAQTEILDFQLHGTSTVRVWLREGGQARRQADATPDEASGRTHASP